MDESLGENIAISQNFSFEVRHWSGTGTIYPSNHSTKLRNNYNIIDNVVSWVTHMKGGEFHPTVLKDSWGNTCFSYRSFHSIRKPADASQ